MDQLGFLQNSTKRGKIKKESFIMNEFLTTYENYQQKLAYKPRHPAQQESNLSVQLVAW
jgi:hypothetical protein